MNQDDDDMDLESPTAINALTDKQVRNRTLYFIGLQTVALQAVADSVDRIASAMEAMTSIDLPTIDDADL